MLGDYSDDDLLAELGSRLTGTDDHVAPDPSGEEVIVRLRTVDPAGVIAGFTVTAGYTTVIPLKQLVQLADGTYAVATITFQATLQYP